MGGAPLTASELAALVARVFVPTEEDRFLGVMVDLPDDRFPDDEPWRRRRAVAEAWVGLLEQQADGLGYHTRLLLYPTTGTCRSAAGSTAAAPSPRTPPSWIRQAGSPWETSSTHTPCSCR
jgi:hypothetical protein